MKLLNWNIQWKRPGSTRGNKINEIIASHNPNVACITEGFDCQFQIGHTICSEADCGYPIIEGRRKVVLWSRNQWLDVDTIGHRSLPTGRFVAGTTVTPIGDIRFIGVCIPWSAAHVSSGTRDRKRWDDHIAYLEGLKEIIANVQDLPLVVVGDFNQTFPRTRAPKRVYAELESTFANLKVGTENVVDDGGSNAIDHVCHSSDVTLNHIGIIPKTTEAMRLSDHFGMRCCLSRFAQSKSCD